MSRRRGPLVVGMLAGLLGTLPAPTAAQLIGLRTIPVASGDQFLIYPSENLAIGGVRLALSDPLLDPFVNPSREPT
jgi:hypothetical protein